MLFYGSRNHNFQIVVVLQWLKITSWKKSPSWGLEVTTNRSMTHRNLIKVPSEKMRGIICIHIYIMHIERFLWLWLIQRLRFLLSPWIGPLVSNCILLPPLLPWWKHIFHRLYHFFLKDLATNVTLTLCYKSASLS